MKKKLFSSNIFIILLIGGFFGFMIGRSMDPIDLAIRKAEKINAQTKFSGSLRPGGAFNIFGIFSKYKNLEEEILDNPRKQKEYFNTITNQINDKEKSIDILEEQKEFIALAKQEVFIDQSLQKYHYSLGRLQLQNGMVYQAVTNLEKAFYITPNHPSTIQMLALTYLGLYNSTSGGSQKDTLSDKAIFYATQSLKFDPNNQDMLYGLGLIYIDLGQHENAIPVFSKMLEQNPENLNALLGVARVYFDQKEFDKARRIYEQTEALILEKKSKKSFIRREFNHEYNLDHRLSTIRKNLEIIYKIRDN